MQVCNISTPANYFHVLRRQKRLAIQTPLIIMSPKSILRLPEARSSKDEFINGSFQEFFDDDTISDKTKIKRLLITSGKVYYDLLKYRRKNKITDTAIIRIEQFYPFKKENLKQIIDSYKNADSVVWVQEEPKNMGAWNFLNQKISELLSDKQSFHCTSRPEAASSAVGSARISNQLQVELIKDAFLL